ncbi:MAG: ornithine cyclodeaminase family protein [Thiothrix sp.]|nr:ornithine cyclodeaminase family protein [Thiothrix sp.]HPQ94339.1 hypothetical protein [Thiolinea sp.]
MQNLNRSRLESLNLSSADIMHCLEQVILAQERGEAHAAPKSALVPGDGRFLMTTLSTLNKPPLMAVKAVVVNQDNPARWQLPVINGHILLMHSHSGELLALLDGSWVTEVRTAAASALAARYLARPDAGSIAFIGCGAQARMHLKLFADQYPLTEIHALGRGAANRDALCAQARSLGLAAHASPDARTALEAADMVISTLPITSEDPPFLDARWLRPGAFMSSVDLGIPWLAEGMARFDRIAVNDLATERMEKPMLDMQLVAYDLMMLAANPQSRRQQTDECNAFVFRAVPLGDLALAMLAWERVQE